MSSFTFDDKIREIRRELAMRKSLYPKWVDSGRMKMNDAEYRIGIMQAIHDDIVKHADETAYLHGVIEDIYKLPGGEAVVAYEAYKERKDG